MILKNFIAFIGYFQLILNLQIRLLSQLQRIGLKKIKDEGKYHFDIEVDGGINFSNSKIVLEAGADILVSGTTVFKENDGNIKINIEKLKSM